MYKYLLIHYDIEEMNRISMNQIGIHVTTYPRLVVYENLIGCWKWHSLSVALMRHLTYEYKILHIPVYLIKL